jgi:carbon starvation protein
MNALTLFVISGLVFVLAYRYYSAFLAAKVLSLDGASPTPSQRRNDGRDYVPTNRWVLFGHHFAAISGAGPLIGPVLAAQFGYLPGFLWILIGAVLAGAVHDMFLLFASVRHDGQSLLTIIKGELGPFSGWVGSLAVLFLVILTMAGASISIVNALYRSPWGTFTVGVTIPISIFIGLYLKWIRPGRIVEATFIGVSLIVGGVFVGSIVPGSALGPYLSLSREQLNIGIPVYSFLAAGLPVWLLLLPRDYLSSYIKVGTMVLLAVGIVAANPVLQMPAMTTFVAGGGPVIPGKVWPFLFITLSCGALSGYHSIVCSGTTPKMVRSETDIRAIGYGAMLVEAVVAVTALVSATVFPQGDYFAINTTPEVFSKLGMKVQELPVLSQLIGEKLAGRPGGAVSLAVGMADIFSGISGNKQLMKFWYYFAITFQALFILTLIDAGTRAGRYLLHEIGGTFYKPLKDVTWWPGVVLTAGLFCLAWGYLLSRGTISTIWPLFGTNNQLLGSIALVVGSTMLIKAGKKRYLWVTLVPLTFLFITAVTAAYQNVVYNYLPRGNYLLATIAIVFFVLVVLIIGDAVRIWARLLSPKAGTLPASGSRR